MARYWIKLDEFVEGPYESRVLKFIDGFNKETLVSSDEIRTEELWLKAEEVAELRQILGIQEMPASPASSTDGPSGGTATANEDLSKTDKSAEIFSEIETPQNEKIFNGSFVEDQTQPSVPSLTQYNEGTAPSLSSLEEGAEILFLPKPDSEPMPDSEILEVMEKISEELKKKEQEQKETIRVLPQETTVPSPKLRRKSSIITAGLTLAIVAAVGILWKSEYFFIVSKNSRRWKDFAFQKISFWKKTPEESGTALPVQETAQTPMALLAEGESAGKPAKPTSETLPQEKSKPVTAVRKKVAKSTQAVSEPELKSQKYLLPGVPSPNVTQKKSQQISQPSEQKKEEKQKKKEKEKQFKDVEWMSKTGW